MSNPPALFGAPIAELDDEEKLWALLAHLSPLVCLSFIGPVIALLVKQDSAYVKYHAIQAIAMQLAAVVIVVPATWLTCGLGAPLGLLPLILSIYLGVQAYNGTWEGYPVLASIGKPPPDKRFQG